MRTRNGGGEAAQTLGGGAVGGKGDGIACRPATDTASITIMNHFTAPLVNAPRYHSPINLGRSVLPVGRLVNENIQLLGTCFSVGPGRYATAAHVVGLSDKDLRIVHIPGSAIDGYQDTTDERVMSAPVTILGYDPIRDIAIIGNTGIKIYLISPGRFNSVRHDDFLKGSGDSVSPGDRMVALGFPHAIYGRMVLTEQTGTVGARILLGAGREKVKHIVLNMITRPGQSGGPVLHQDKRTISGMLVGGYSPSKGFGMQLGGIDPSTIHQTTHAVSAEYIWEML